MDMDSNLTFSLPPELVQKYVSRRFTDVEVCWSALKELDFTKVADLGHQMKGNGTNFGFPLISEIGADLETAAKQNDSETISDRLNKLQDFLKTVE
jgi:HPt (histidine-containing phosphotransfer) domain-containing protein